MMSAETSTWPCANCGFSLAPGLLACPRCSRLVHSERLAALAREAEDATQRGEVAAAVEAWREALALLPPNVRQREQIGARIDALVAAAPTAALKRPGASRWGPLASVGALLLFVLSKAKFLGAGLTKLPTLLSMFAFFGVYWAAFGWVFALGLVLSIYVHEMGHAFEMRRRGIPMSAPMFIPGFGALIRMGARPSTPVEDNRIGLAGPLWGLGAALAAWVLWKVTDAPAFGATARMAAWLNLFNLLPVWQLDGSRGMASLVRWQRVVVVAAFFLAFALTDQPLLFVIGLVAAFRVFGRELPEAPDHLGLGHFLFLIAALSALGAMHVPV